MGQTLRDLLVTVVQKLVCEVTVTLTVLIDLGSDLALEAGIRNLNSLKC